MKKKVSKNKAIAPVPGMWSKPVSMPSSSSICSFKRMCERNDLKSAVVITFLIRHSMDCPRLSLCYKTLLDGGKNGNAVQDSNESKSEMCPPFVDNAVRSQSS